MAGSGGYSGAKVFKRLFRYMLHHPIQLSFSIFLIILMAVFSSIVPVLIGLTIDRGVAVGDWWSAVLYGLLILGAVALSSLASFIGRYMLARLAQDTVYDLRVESLQSLMRQPLTYYNRVFTGQLISRITNDTERITRFLSFRLRMLIYSVLLIGISIYYMYGMSYTLTLITLATIIATAIVNTLYANRVRPVYDSVRNQTGVLASIASGALSGVKTVKGLALEPIVMDRFEEGNIKYYNASLEATKLSVAYGDSSILILALSMTGILYFGGEGILKGVITVGVLAAFLTYMLTLRRPLYALGFIIGDIERSVAAAKRIFEVIDSSPDSLDPPDAIELDHIHGGILVDDVYFSYQESKIILKGVNLRVRRDEKILIVGPPGSGKSTILRLIARLYEPDRGRIFIDDVDISRFSSKTLRRNIAYVLQEPFIFNRSIRENIVLGKPNASLKEIMEAAKTAKIHDMIVKLPMGYDTLVGERGITLSGGQRQRIALARALLAGAKILLLDDPVSNLDAETEEALVNDLERILEGRTALIVSQRPSMARIVDRIIVLVDGRIVEEGRHEELLEKRGIYYKLYVSWVKRDGRSVDDSSAQ